MIYICGSMSLWVECCTVLHEHSSYGMVYDRACRQVLETPPCKGSHLILEMKRVLTATRSTSTFKLSCECL